MNLALLAAHLAKPTETANIGRGGFNFSRIQEILEGQYRPAMQKAEQVLEIHEKLQIGMVTAVDAHYPQHLSDLDYPPPVLFWRGDVSLLAKQCISIVGTRTPSTIGLSYTQALTKYFIENNQVIISGMARGIDSCAHRTALKYGGATIAVVAHGLDRVYPLQNHDLFSLWREHKNFLLVSEYAAGTPPLKFHFHRRNRVISGFSLQTVMVEGAKESGAMITTKNALKQHRDVFVFDHPDMPNNGGCRQHILDGADNLADCFDLQTHTFGDAPKGSIPFYFKENRWATITMHGQGQGWLFTNGKRRHGAS